MFTKVLCGLSKKLTLSLFIILTALSLILGGCSEFLNEQELPSSVTQNRDHTKLTESSSPLTSFEDVAGYIRSYGKLPDNFITKKEAELLGWVASEGNLQEVAPGKSIGGDRFGNREGLLPKADGRIWYEADINYSGGRRNADRILFSNDGLIYMTTDHYASFTDITKEDK